MQQAAVEYTAKVVCRTIVLVAVEGLAAGEAVLREAVALPKLGEAHLGRRQQAVDLHPQSICLTYC